jgi:hypothetical protein
MYRGHTVRPHEVTQPSTPGVTLDPDPAVESGRGGLEVALSVSALETLEEGGLGISSLPRTIYLRSEKNRQEAAKEKEQRRRKSGSGRRGRKGMRRKKNNAYLIIPNIPFAQCCPTVQ